MDIQQSDSCPDITTSFDNKKLTATKTKPKLTGWATWSSTIVIFSGIFQYGYSTGSVNAAAEPMQQSIQQYHLERYNTTFTSKQLEMVWVTIAAAFPIGGLVGCLVVNTLVHKLGHLKSLVYMHCVTISMSVLYALSHVIRSYEFIVMARFFLGVSSSCAGTGIAPLYVVEVVPTQWRGVFGSLVSFFIHIGLLSSNALGLQQVFGTVALWPVLLGITGLPSVLFICLAYFMPNCPRCLYITEGKHNEAKKLLKKLRKTEDVSDEIAEMHKEFLVQRLTTKLSVIQLLKSPAFRPQLLSTVILTISYQCTGLNGVVMYMNNLFRIAGVKENISRYFSIIIPGVLAFLGILASVVIKKVGRRPLLIGGYVAEGVFLVLLSVSIRFQKFASWLPYFAIFCSCGYLISFLFGPGVVTLVIVAEFFTQAARPSAMVLACAILWFGFTLVVMVFPYMQVALGPYAYLIFAAVALGTAIFLYFAIPETRGRSFLEIEKSFPQIMSCCKPRQRGASKELNLDVQSTLLQ